MGHTDADPGEQQGDDGAGSREHGVALVQIRMPAVPVRPGWIAHRQDPVAGARLKAGLRQSELADKAGLSVRSIQQWEQDARTRRALALLALARALGVEVEVLIAGRNRSKDRGPKVRPGGQPRSRPGGA